MAGICGLKFCMHLEDVFLNTMGKPHAILSTITGDIAIRILRGSQISKLQRHALTLYKFMHI